jgi:DNA repair photolyase
MPSSPGSGGASIPPPPSRPPNRNPPNRFERVHTAEMPELGFAPGPDDPPEDPRTELLVDPSRTIVATNDSPDLGFRASVNPYRGCQHACSYCLAPTTPVLRANLSWTAMGELKPGDEIVGFDEFPRDGSRTRKLRKSVVEGVWWSRKPSLRLVTDRAEVVTTAEHRWLQWRSFRWSRADQLAPRRKLRFLLGPSQIVLDGDYRIGYVAGLSLGDGTFRWQPGWRSDKLGFPAAYWRVAMADREPLERCIEYLQPLGIPLALRPFDSGPTSRRPLLRVETRSHSRLELVDKIIHAELESASYRRGFVAGFFDAEGLRGDTLPVSQVDRSVLERVARYAASLGFELELEPRECGASAARLLGSVRERMRFLAEIRPAIQRKIDRCFGIDPATEPTAIEAVEAGPIQDVVDIQTSTRTFYAAGLATHNCYARPTHEYLGYSAGLDFQTKILVKPRAAELLRKQLLSPAWKPQPLALSGVTDAYQPAERRLRITRGVLEVLAEFRNPVVIVTKGFLVTRDVDLLGELARANAASVMLSVTTLDAALQRKMEPLASPPSKRLAAIEALARAGVPVGVMTAPVIPGLTDHELPAILQAAADAGASHAGLVVLRLPHGVKELFGDWLAEHFPERREKVLNRLRALHDGALYDARFSHRQRGSGEFADQIQALFELGLKRARMARRGPELSTTSFRRPGVASQLGLFGES